MKLNHTKSVLIEYNKQAGFSLIELIIVISIMAVLLVILTPNMLKYLDRTKRTKNVHTAWELSGAMERVAIIDDPGTSAGHMVYTTAVMWNKSTPFPVTPANVVECAFIELGEVPVSAVNKDFFWIMQYDAATGVVSRIYLAESPDPSSPQYELYPDGSAYIAGN